MRANPPPRDGSQAAEDPAVPGPVLLLCSGQRSGSTLLQRVASSGPDLWVWGEPGPGILALRDADLAMRALSDHRSHEAAAEVGHAGPPGFIAVVLPPVESYRSAARAWFDTAFADAPRRWAGARWGFKEVRLGRPFAEWFVDLYPGARVVHLVRHPLDVLRSLLSWEEQVPRWTPGLTAEAMGNWLTVVDSFHTEGADPPWLLRLSYEELASVRADRAGAVDALEAHLGLAAGSLDRSVLGRRIHRPGAVGRRPRVMPGDAEVARRFAAMATRDRVRDHAERLGYRLP
ncbi:sulfotransferase [Nocardiopsis sp. NPDC101807]|uniref:sulfotransferase n=1 Tax=Nocardiopsis sp. NPDC101807 TaxID=3364339 RepID=UPI00380895BA